MQKAQWALKPEAFSCRLLLYLAQLCLHLAIAAANSTVVLPAAESQCASANGECVVVPLPSFYSHLTTASRLVVTTRQMSGPSSEAKWGGWAKAKLGRPCWRLHNFQLHLGPGECPPQQQIGLYAVAREEVGEAGSPKGHENEMEWTAVSRCQLGWHILWRQPIAIGSRIWVWPRESKVARMGRERIQ